MIQENLAKHPDVMFGADYSGRRVNKVDLVGFDLCVLSASHHTVITYGTFGLWGSLLAGGEVIAAKGRNNLTLTEVGGCCQGYLFSIFCQIWLFKGGRNLPAV